MAEASTEHINCAGADDDMQLHENAPADGEEVLARADDSEIGQAPLDHDDTMPDSVEDAVEMQEGFEREEAQEEEDTMQDLLDYGDGEEPLDYGEPGGSEVDEDEQPNDLGGEDGDGLQGSGLGAADQEAPAGKSIPAAYYESNLEQQEGSSTYPNTASQGRDRTDRRSQLQHSNPRDNHHQAHQQGITGGRGGMGRPLQQQQQREQQQSGRSGMSNGMNGSMNGQRGQHLPLQQQGSDSFRQQQRGPSMNNTGMPPHPPHLRAPHLPGVSNGMQGFGLHASHGNSTNSHLTGIQPPKPPPGVPYMNGHGNSGLSHVPSTAILPSSGMMPPLPSHIHQQHINMQQQMPQLTPHQQQVAAFTRLLHGANQQSHMSSLHQPLSSNPLTGMTPSMPHPSMQFQQQPNAALTYPSSMASAAASLHHMHVINGQNGGMPVLKPQGLLLPQGMAGSATSVPVIMPSIFTASNPAPAASSQASVISSNQQRQQTNQPTYQVARPFPEQNSQQAWRATAAAFTPAAPFVQPPSAHQAPTRQHFPAQPGTTQQFPPQKRSQQTDLDILYGGLDLAEGMTGLHSHSNHRSQLQPHSLDEGDEEQDFVSMVPAVGGPEPQLSRPGAGGYKGAAGGVGVAGAVRGKRQWTPDGMPPLEVPAGPWAYTGPPSPNSAAAAALLQQQQAPRSNKWVRPGDPAAATAAAAAAAAASAATPAPGPLRAAAPASAPAATVTAEAAMLASVVAKQEEFMEHLKRQIAAQEAAGKKRRELEARKRARAAAGDAALAPLTTATLGTEGASQMDLQSLPQTAGNPSDSFNQQQAPFTVSPTRVTRATPSHVHPSTRAAALGAPAAQHLSAAGPSRGGLAFSRKTAQGVSMGMSSADGSRVAAADGDIPGLYESHQEDGFEFQGDDAALFEGLGTAATGGEPQDHTESDPNPVASLGVGSDVAALKNRSPAKSRSSSRSNGHRDTDAVTVSAEHVLRGGVSNQTTASGKVVHRGNQQGVEEAGGQPSRNPSRSQKPVQHQAEQQSQQQQRQPHQQQAEGRQQDLEDSRSRNSGYERADRRADRDGQESGSSRQNRGDSQQEGGKADRPDRSSSRRREGSSEHLDSEPSAAGNSRSHRSERALNGGDGSNQSRSRSGHQKGEADEGSRKRGHDQGLGSGQAPVEFDLRATLDAAKRLKLAKEEEAGKQHRTTKAPSERHHRHSRRSSSR